jgi:hypothetical protein
VSISCTISTSGPFGFPKPTAQLLSGKAHFPRSRKHESPTKQRPNHPALRFVAVIPAMPQQHRVIVSRFF